MSIIDNLADEIFQVLKGSGKILSLFDTNGKRVFEPALARRMFAQPDKMMISIDDEGFNSEVKLLLSQSIDISSIKRLLETLRQLCTRFNVLFNVRKYGRELAPKDFAYQSFGKAITSNEKSSTENKVKESEEILEAMYGSAKISYQKFGESKLMIKHSSKVNEEIRGSRSRHINALFVETTQGERFRFPLIHLSAARAWARHINEGGRPFDDISQYIIELAHESKKLTEINKHIRKNQKTLTEEALSIKDKVKDRVLEIRKTLGKISRERGYIKATENVNFSFNIINENQDAINEEYKRLGIILGIQEGHALMDALMPVALLTRGEPMTKPALYKFHKVIALENIDNLVETLTNEYGYREGKHWAKSNKKIGFILPEAFNDAKNYLDLSDIKYSIFEDINDTFVGGFSSGKDLPVFGKKKPSQDIAPTSNEEINLVVRQIDGKYVVFDTVSNTTLKVFNANFEAYRYCKSLNANKEEALNIIRNTRTNDMTQRMYDIYQTKQQSKISEAEDTFQPTGKVLAYAEKWVTKQPGGNKPGWSDITRQPGSAEWTPTDETEVDEKAKTLAQGLIDILRGRLQVNLVPNKIHARISDPKSQARVKIGRLIAAGSGLQNNMLFNYLSVLIDKINSDLPLSPVEQQVADAAIKTVDRLENLNKPSELPDEESYNESAIQPNDKVSTPSGNGEVIEILEDKYAVVELENGEEKEFLLTDIKKIENNIETQGLVDWFNNFNPDKFLQEKECSKSMKKKTTKKKIKDVEECSKSKIKIKENEDDFSDTSDFDSSPDENFYDEDGSQALEYAKDNFNFEDFISQCGKNFGWGEKGTLSAEEKDIPENEMINYVTDYITDKINDYLGTDDSVPDEEKISEAAKEIFEEHIRSALESVGYTFNENDSEDNMGESIIDEEDFNPDFSQDYNEGSSEKSFPINIGPISCVAYYIYNLETSKIELTRVCDESGKDITSTLDFESIKQLENEIQGVSSYNNFRNPEEDIPEEYGENDYNRPKSKIGLNVQDDTRLDVSKGSPFEPHDIERNRRLGMEEDLISLRRLAGIK